MILASAALALSACAPEGAVGGTTYDLSLYPSCEEQSEEADFSQGCIMTAEGMTHALLLNHAEGTASVQVVADGEAGQLIAEPAGETNFFPALFDINSDGRPDLWIPKETGNVNTVWAVYRADEDASYTRLGEVSGIGFGLSANGLLAIPSRSNAATFEVAFYRADPAALTEAAAVTVTISPTAEGETAIACALARKEEGETLPDDQLTALYCGDAQVAGLFE
jgi:hypothetical protein